MKLLDVLLEAICDSDEGFAKGLKIIDKFHEIYDGDFGERLAKAPNENYDEIMEHLEKIDELLGGNK